MIDMIKGNPKAINIILASVLVYKLLMTLTVELKRVQAMQAVQQMEANYPKLIIRAWSLHVNVFETSESVSIVFPIESVTKR